MRPITRTSFAACLVVALLLDSSIAAVTTSAAPALPAWRAGTPWSTETARVRVGDHVVVAEIADTAELRSRGLGFRDGLAPGTGMLFVYERPGVRSFWMKGMRFCLDIIWIENGEVIGAAEHVCHEPGVPDAELQRYRSNEPVRYVLEVPAGWLAERGYGPGTPVDIELPGDR